MNNNEKLRNLADGACEEMQCLKDNINAFIKLDEIGVKSEEDIKSIVQQCMIIINDIYAINDIVKTGWDSEQQ
jgi:hypothetical protein